MDSVSSQLIYDLTYSINQNNEYVIKIEHLTHSIFAFAIQLLHPKSLEFPCKSVESVSSKLIYDLTYSISPTYQLRFKDRRFNTFDLCIYHPIIASKICGISVQICGIRELPIDLWFNIFNQSEKPMQLLMRSLRH